MLAITALFAGLVLSGCATVKPVMTETEYTNYAKGYLIVDYCGWKGWMPSDTAALGKTYIRAATSRYIADPIKFDAEVRSIRNTWLPNQGDCNQMSTTIKEKQHNIMVNNQAVDYNNQSNQEYINSTKLRNTNCNRIGNQLLCNTY